MNNGKIQMFFFMNIFPLHQKRLFKKNNASFLKKNLKDVLHALDEKRKNIASPKRAEYYSLFETFRKYFPLIHQKHVRRLFFFFWKSLHNFHKKDAFGEKRENDASFFIKKIKKMPYTLLMKKIKYCKYKKVSNRA